MTDQPQAGNEQPTELKDSNPNASGPDRAAGEMGVSAGWWKYGCAAVVGIDTYGESAPAPALFKYFHFTPENVAATVRAVLKKG